MESSLLTRVDPKADGASYRSCADLYTGFCLWLLHPMTDIAASSPNHSYFSYRGAGMEMETSSYEVDTTATTQEASTLGLFHHQPAVSPRKSQKYPKEEEEEERWWNTHPDDDEQDDFLKKLYDQTVDAPCQRLTVAPCMASIEEQLDLFMVS